jgi:hypothetical protein
MEFLAEPMVIDFFASHDMQKQCGQSVFDLLSHHHRCVWRGERDHPSPGAGAAVVLGHVSDFPQARKSRGGYDYAFFLSHDLGEMDKVYSDFYMRQFDIVFVPGHSHAENARRRLDPCQRVEVVGWPKYDIVTLEGAGEELLKALDTLDRGRTIIYGPSYAQRGDWRRAFEVFEAMDVTVIVKNHVYYSAADRESYRARQGNDPVEIIACEEMESAARRSGNGRFIVAPRELNICALFPYARWLVSDSSSCLAEFGPFGTAVETMPPGEMHALFPEVVYAGIERLPEILRESPPSGVARPSSVFRHATLGAGELAARAIDACFLSTPPESARAASARRLGTLFRIEARIGEGARFKLFLALRVIRNPGLLFRVIGRQRKIGSKGPQSPTGEKIKGDRR